MSGSIDWVALFVNWLPVLVILAVWLFVMMRVGGGVRGLSQAQYLEQILAETRRHNAQMEQLIEQLIKHREK